MANVDKRWAWLSVPVIVLFAFMCCCGGGGLIYFLIPNSPKIVYTSNSPAGDVRLDVTELRKTGVWTYDLSLIDSASNRAFAGTPPHITSEKQVKFNAEWLLGSCFVGNTDSGVWVGSHSGGSQSWFKLDTR